MSYYPDFVKMLNEMLAQNDRTPAWLARRLGVNPSTVNRWLNHGSRPGDPEIVARLCDVLGCQDRLQDLLITAGYGYQEAPEGDGYVTAVRSPDKAGDGMRSQRSATAESTVAAAEIPNNLPPQATALVGREEELAALCELLDDPTIRLVTLMGPGGMGKTRLALAAAEVLLESGRFQDGVYYVSLAAIAKRQNMVTAIADALGLSSAGRDLEKSILNQLRSVSAMVVLDNFEQLVDESDFVAEMLSTAPRVQLMVTTRRRLNLQEEWAIDLHGLTYPREQDRENLVEYDAVKLLDQRIEQVNNAWKATDEDMQYMATICQLVQGMPLALELAAGWTRYMMLDEIINEIESNIDIFSTTVLNVPERHRSLRAVFRQSWQMLTRAEQRAYAALSVFRGGFSRKAATEVAGVSLPVIASMVDKSLVSRVMSGHYEIQDMLRQFAAEKLENDAELEAAARSAHAQYYCRYLAERTVDLHGERQLETLKEIVAERENVRTAWYTAVSTRQLALIDMALEGWYLLAELGGYVQQGFRGLDRALTVVEETAGDAEASDGSKIPLGEERLSLLLARTLSRHAFLFMRVGGAYPGIIAEMERSLMLTSAIHDTGAMDVRDELAYVENALGLQLYFNGVEERAESHIRHALEIAQETENAYEIGNAWSYLAHLAEFQGRYTDAAQLFSRSIDYYILAGESNRKAYSLNNWGRACYGMGDYDRAEELVHEALAIRRAFNDQVGIAYSLLALGEIADCLGEYENAEAVMREGLVIARAIANEETVMRYLIGLGDVARHMGKTVLAESYLNEAHKIGQELVIPTHRPIYLAGLGKVLYLRGEEEVARALFEESLTLSIEMRNVGEEAEVRFSLAKIDLNQGRLEESKRHVVRCLEIAIETGARPVALAAMVLAVRMDLDGMRETLPPEQLLRFIAMQFAAWEHTRDTVAEMMGGEYEEFMEWYVADVGAQGYGYSVEEVARMICVTIGDG